MLRFVGMLGTAAVWAGLAGCGTPTGATPLAAPESRALQTLDAPASMDSASQEATAPIVYRNPRYPLHSDRFEFRTGTFQPIDDGMGPRGDVSFFYNGSRFFVIANSQAASDRGIAPVTATTFQQGPLPVTPGATYRVKTPDGLAVLEIERLDPGTMKLTPEEGAGAGAVVFRYRIAG